MDPHLCQCGSGSASSFLPQCRPRCGSGFRESNLCGSGLVRLKSQKKLNFYQKSIFKIGDRSKTYLRRYRCHFEWQEPGLLVNFGKFPCSWIRIRIRNPNTDLDPDPGKPNQCGSGVGPGSTTLPVTHNLKRLFGTTLIFYFRPRFEVHSEQKAFFSASTSTSLWQPFLCGLCRELKLP